MMCFISSEVRGPSLLFFFPKSEHHMRAKHHHFYVSNIIVFEQFCFSNISSTSSQRNRGTMLILVVLYSIFQNVFLNQSPKWRILPDSLPLCVLKRIFNWFNSIKVKLQLCRVWQPELRRYWGASQQQVATRIDSLSSNSEKCNSRRDQNCHVSRLAATRNVLCRHEKRDTFGLP